MRRSSPLIEPKCTEPYYTKQWNLLRNEEAFTH